MGVITLLSDFGTEDHYIAALKAKLITNAPKDTLIFDITHQIPKFNIIHAAYTINSIYRDFPEKTIHILGVNNLDSALNKHLIAEIDNHYFIGSDNGLLSLIGTISPTKLIEIRTEKESTFPEKDFYVNAALSILKNDDWDQIGTEINQIKDFKAKEISFTDNAVFGSVIHSDSYGNLITNIEKGVFETLKNTREYTLKISFETISRVSNTYSDVEGGELVVFFNNRNLLEIAINKGNASQLLGLRYDSPISIRFD